MIRLALRVKREHAEIALADLLELAPSGVEETEPDADTVEYAVYGAPGELPELPSLRAIVGGALVEVSATEVPDDWHERWKRFHRPVSLPAPAAGGQSAFYLRPPWEPSLGHRDSHEIVIDPGQAFGTGSHATTKLCLVLLQELVASALHPQGAAIDIGTGSGVLAIAAAKLGFQPVLALDHDPESVLAAKANAAANSAAVEVSRLDLRSDALPEMQGTTVLANLLRPLLLQLGQRMRSVPTDLIVSGLLVEEVDEIAATFASQHGLNERQRRHDGEWAAAWLSAE